MHLRGKYLGRSNVRPQFKYTALEVIFFSRLFKYTNIFFSVASYFWFIWIRFIHFSALHIFFVYLNTHYLFIFLSCKLFSPVYLSTLNLFFCPAWHLFHFAFITLTTIKRIIIPTTHSPYPLSHVITVVFCQYFYFHSSNKKFWKILPIKFTSTKML